LVQYRENQKSISRRRPYIKLDFQSLLSLGVGSAFVLAGLCLISITMAGQGSGTGESSPDPSSVEGGMQVSLSVLGIGLFFVASGISRRRKLRKNLSLPAEAVQPRKPMDISSQALKSSLPENLIGSVALTSLPDVKPRIGPREIIFLAGCVTFLLALVAIGVLLAFN